MPPAKKDPKKDAKQPKAAKGGSSGGGKQKKKKWSKGKNKEKVNNAILFDKTSYEKMLAEVPKFKMITVSILSDRLRINCSLARRVLVLLTVRRGRGGRSGARAGRAAGLRSQRRAPLRRARGGGANPRAASAARRALTRCAPAPPAGEGPDQAGGGARQAGHLHALRAGCRLSARLRARSLGWGRLRGAAL
jgi:small subunit ribosomal protein S25e